MQLAAVAPPVRRPPPTSSSLPGTEGDDHAAVSGARVVLVVDDNEDLRELYSAILTGAGYVVVEASNGQEALDKIAESKPALVMMDLTMPVLDGWQATKQIKENAATADIFVIAVTAIESATGLRDAREVGADDVLTKPCLPDDMVRLVKKLLSDG